MATLAHKTILLVGGSSGIGYGVAKGAALSGAEHIIIASSSQSKVEAAVNRLKDHLSAVGHSPSVKITGENVDAKDSGSVKALLERVGEIDHLVWTSGTTLRLGFPNIDIEQNKDAFDLRFWGPFTAAKYAKFRAGGSLTLTTGSGVFKPPKTWSLAAGVGGSVDALTRGLAVDLAPIRVNIICPGFVKTELWDGMPHEVKNKLFEEYTKKLLVQHIADADEVAEAYLFVMKCKYITGQRIEVDGGFTLIQP